MYVCVCCLGKSMGDYVRVRYKATQKLAVMQMMVDGKMNSEFSMTDFVTDDDLNKSLEFYVSILFLLFVSCRPSHILKEH